MKKIPRLIAAPGRIACAAGARADAADGRQLRRRQRQRAEEGLLRAVREEPAPPRSSPVEYNGEQAKIKAMVETKKVTWDVVEVEIPDVAAAATKACSRSSTTAKIGNKADFLPAAVHECGIGIFVWSTVMAYNGDKLKDAPDRPGPTSGTRRNSPASAACARARATTSSSR